MAERDRMFKKHPNTKFVAAHMAWYANDLAVLAGCSIRCPTCPPRLAPSCTTSAASRTPAHDFFIKYQDRLLFGKDSFQPEEYPYTGGSSRRRTSTSTTTATTTHSGSCMESACRMTC